ncbi:MAG: anaerobic ribonucleoside-triphosphate reductase activating protein [Victivallales bacterium]|nr:anaerobic ribonucleoside-triphosphate reductase activating protein [Victivallales bacterium]
MDIRGITKFTLVDYPGKLACIIFTGGCNFCCPYCHNPFLVVDPESQPLVAEEEFYQFLESRKGKLDAVVISGGEPALQQDLFDFAQKIKDKGFLVKLDTNGTKPETVKELHKNKCIDYIGLDYKAPTKKYHIAAGVMDSKISQKVKETIMYAVSNKLSYDIRTTVHKALIKETDMALMRKELDCLGVKEWTLQQFHPAEIMEDELLEIPTYTDTELKEIAAQFKNTKVRGLAV